MSKPYGNYTYLILNILFKLRIFFKNENYNDMMEKWQSFLCIHRDPEN